MYAKLFGELRQAQIEFLVVGGAAVSLHGYGRMTTDIDIIIKNEPANIGRFISAISRWCPAAEGELTPEDLQGPGCLRIEDAFPLDVFTVLNGKTYEQYLAKSNRCELDSELELRFLSIDDLIECKKGTMREKDQLDVVVLRRLQAEPGTGDSPSINLDVEPSRARAAKPSLPGKTPLGPVPHVRVVPPTDLGSSSQQDKHHGKD